MCGIFGNLSTVASPVESMKKCLDTLTHRGPDQCGYYADNETEWKLFLGHRRLSIVDLSDAGRQPFITPDRKVAVAVNGEIYNHRELREELKSKGTVFRSESDSEVLLWGFYHEGEKFFLKLRGMYAAAIWDRRKQEPRLLLLRDRMGIKPLHYQLTRSGIAFASELKALYAIPGAESKINTIAIDHYLTLRYIPSPLTIFENIYKVSPGTYTVFEKGVCRNETYWQISVPEKKYKGSLNDAAEELDFMLNQSVKEQLMGNVPLGAFLSGGIDSSLICAIAQKQMGANTLQTFTIGFDRKQNDESSFAEKTAAFLGTEHTSRIMSSKDLFSILPELSSLHDEPFADDSALPSYLLSSLAAEKVTVALSGDGGDELFFGYTNISNNWNIAGLYEKCPALLRKTSGNILQNIFGESLIGKIGRTISFDSMAQIYARSSGFFCNHLLENLCGHQLNKNTSVLHKTCSFFEKQHIPARYITPFMDMALYLPDDVCCKVDRASMAHSLEVRPPMLDHRIVEFANSLPFNYKYDPKSGGKIILKKVLEKYIPRNLWDRPKMGFSAPVNSWMDNELQKQCDMILSPQNIRKSWNFNSETLSALHTQLSKTYNSKFLLWLIFCLENWRMNMKLPHKKSNYKIIGQ